MCAPFVSLLAGVSHSDVDAGLHSTVAAVPGRANGGRGGAAAIAPPSAMLRSAHKRRPTAPLRSSKFN